MGELNGVCEAVAATPMHSVGETVSYIDRQGRSQIGVIYGIDAHWNGYGNPDRPLIIYTVSHPSYRGRRFYATAENFESGRAER